MSKSLHCSRIYPGCDFVAHGATDDEVVALATQHARETHYLAETDWTVLAKFCAAVRNGDERVSAA